MSQKIRIPSAYYEDITVTAYNNGDVTFKNSGSSVRSIGSSLESVTFHLEGNATLRCRNKTISNELIAFGINSNASAMIQTKLANLVLGYSSSQSGWGQELDFHTWNKIVPYENLLREHSFFSFNSSDTASITYDDIQTSKGSLGDLNPITTRCNSVRNGNTFSLE